MIRRCLEDALEKANKILWFQSKNYITDALDEEMYSVTMIENLIKNWLKPKT